MPVNEIVIPTESSSSEDDRRIRCLTFAGDILFAGGDHGLLQVDVRTAKSTVLSPINLGLDIASLRVDIGGRSTLLKNPRPPGGVNSLSGFKHSPVWHHSLDDDGASSLTGDKGWVAIGYWHRLSLWDLNSGAVRKLINDYVDYKVFAFTPDGALAACLRSNDDVIEIWDLRSGYTTTGWLRRERRGAEISVLLFFPRGDWLAAGSFGGEVDIWDVQTGTLLNVVAATNLDPITSLAVSPDGRWLATGGNSGSLSLWDTQKWELVAWLPCRDSVLGIWFGAESNPLEIRAVDAGGVTGIPNVYVLECKGF